jgi:hypothetical protein
MVGAAGCVLAIVAAACGGGTERLSGTEYVREATKSCDRANRAVARVEVPSLADAHRAADAMARVVVIERDAIDDLRALRPPDHLAGTTQTWIALLDQGTDELELMGRRLRAGQGPEASEYGAKATTLLDRAREVVAPLRVTSCRGPVLPPV